jgi:acylphosphatase
VRVVAEGSTPALEKLEALLSDGPSGARVENLDVRWAEARGGLHGFGVRADAHSGD